MNGFPRPDHMNAEERRIKDDVTLYWRNSTGLSEGLDHQQKVGSKARKEPHLTNGEV